MAIAPYTSPADLMSSMLDDMFRRPYTGREGRVAGANLMRSPSADVVEAQDHLRVMVELPGMGVEDVDLSLENNVLTIAGEKTEERQEENDTWHLAERRYGRFSRSFVLPRDVDQEKIEAHFDNGVLTVTIPKSEKARRRRIEIGDGRGRQRVEAGANEG